MCLQCVTDPLGWELVPGFWLMLARKPHPDWQRWCVVSSNDPSFTFEIDPVCDPEWGMSDEELDSSTLDDSQYWDFVEVLDEATKGSLMWGYQFTKACMEAGYDPEQHGYRLTAWLAQRMGEVIKTKPHHVNHVTSEQIEEHLKEAKLIEQNRLQIDQPPV